ncbi:hypothetical protein HDU93_003628, partial [Gonapodya sp. JEL0774]
PCHEVLWSPDREAHNFPSAQLSQVLLRGADRLLAMPQLRLFLDPLAWPIEHTNDLCIGALALSTVLNVHCFGRVLEY